MIHRLYCCLRMFVLGLLSAACSGDTWLFVGLVAFPKHPLDDVQRLGDTDGLGRNLSKRTPSAVPFTTVNDVLHHSSWLRSAAWHTLIKMQAQKYLQDLGLGMLLQIFLVGVDVALQSHHNRTTEHIFHKHAWQGKVPAETVFWRQG